MTRHGCILLVEDDENDVFFLKLAFEKVGICNPVHLARHGQEAIDYLAGDGKFADRLKYPLPCLIILDLKMPVKTGMDVLQWLSQQPELECLPVMVFSSSAQKFDIDRAYRFGANGFVTKPASIEERLELAKGIQIFWLTFNHPPLVCSDALDEIRRLREQNPNPLL